MDNHKIHKPKEDNFITFMIFSKSSKNYKTYRLAKWIFIPILIVIFTFNGILFNEVYGTYSDKDSQKKEINKLDETISKLNNDINKKSNYIASLEQTKQQYDEQLNLIKKQTEEFQQQLQNLNKTKNTIENKLHGTKKTTDSMPTSLRKSSRNAVYDEKISSLEEVNTYTTENVNTDTTEAFAKKVSDLSLSLKQSTDIIDTELNNLNELNKEADQIIPYWDSYPSIMPVSGYISSPYGWRKDPTKYGNEFHKGIDIAGSYSTPIKATGDGTIISSSYERGYGYCVTINHGYGLSTKYAHCKSNLPFKVGVKVKRGDIIAYRGNSGNSTGPHLHYEVRLYGETKNPINYIYTEDK